MDSLDFMRTVDPEPSREAADAALEVALQWVGRNAIPERVFSDEQLGTWATQHGYSKHAGADLVELLRLVRPYLTAYTRLLAEVDEAIWAYTQRA